jgi:signal transduction histidine kinase
VVISDDGIGGDALPTRVGSGLMGLRERAASASACLTAGPTDSGFSVALDAAIHDSDDVPMEAER